MATQAGAPPVAGTELCGIQLRGPVLNGSGTFDAIAARRTFGDALLDDFPFDAFVSKTITLEPRGGNPPPRLWEAPAGLINSIGLPNVETGLVMGADPTECARAVEAVRPLTKTPLIVKLTPNADDPAAVARAAEGAGADAVSLVNTLRGMAFDPKTGEPWLGGGSGGLSGPAIRPVALEQVRSVAAAVGIDVVGMGGIASGRDAADFLRAGAACVAVGTETFRDPRAGNRIRDELAALVRGPGGTRTAHSG